jgi:hypothetical protein
MPKSDFKKLLQSKLKEIDFITDYDYFPPYSYVKENDLVLQIITFNPGTIGFACDVAVLPLVVPRMGAIALNFGVTLGHYAKLGFERWPYGDTKQETRQKIEECIEVIRKFGLPWLERTGSEEGIVKYPVDDGTLVHCQPQFRNQYRGYCALHLGQIDKGIKWLQESIAYFKTLEYDYAKKRVQEMREVISIAQNERSRLKEYLDSIVEASRQELFSNRLRVPAKN